MVCYRRGDSCGPYEDLSCAECPASKLEYRLLDCPVCGQKPNIVHLAIEYGDWLVVCPNCGFSYSELGDSGDSKEEAVSLWNYDVQVNGLDSVTLSKNDTGTKSMYWKDRRRWFLQQNKKKD